MVRETCAASVRFLAAPDRLLTTTFLNVTLLRSSEHHAYPLLFASLRKPARELRQV
ncbi:hypothetical protein [Streptomyces sp. NPDC054962]